jgi:hypothetical protein
MEERGAVQCGVSSLDRQTCLPRWVRRGSNLELGISSYLCKKKIRRLSKALSQPTTGKQFVCNSVHCFVLEEALATDSEH